jgi:hypothetical protein
MMVARMYLHIHVVVGAGSSSGGSSSSSGRARCSADVLLHLGGNESRLLLCKAAAKDELRHERRRQRRLVLRARKLDQPHNHKVMPVNARKRLCQSPTTNNNNKGTRASSLAIRMDRL